MSDNKTFELPLDQLKQVCKDIINYAQKNPVQFGLISATIVGGIVTLVVAPIGFTAAGPAAGSIAAAWQASIGNVAAGSLFATLQSVTMNGTLFTIGGAAISVGVAGLVGGAEWDRAIKWAQSVDWANGGADWGEFSNIVGLAGSEAWEKSLEMAGQIADEMCKTGEEVAKGADEFGKEASAKGEEFANGAEKAGGDMGNVMEQAGNDMGKGMEQAGSEIAKGAEQAGNEIAKAFQF